MMNSAHATMWLQNAALVDLGHLGRIADSSLFLRSIGRTGTTTPSEEYYVCAVQSGPGPSIQYLTDESNKSNFGGR